MKHAWRIAIIIPIQNIIAVTSSSFVLNNQVVEEKF